MGERRDAAAAYASPRPQSEACKLDRSLVRPARRSGLLSEHLSECRSPYHKPHLFHNEQQKRKYMSIGYQFLIPRSEMSVPASIPPRFPLCSIPYRPPRPHRFVQRSNHDIDIIHYAKSHAKAHAHIQAAPHSKTFRYLHPTAPCRAPSTRRRRATSKVVITHRIIIGIRLALRQVPIATRSASKPADKSHSLPVRRRRPHQV